MQAEVDPLRHDERGRYVRRLGHVRVRARRVEHAAHRLRCVLRGECDLTVFEHELVEVPEVLADVVVGDRGRLQHGIRFEDSAEPVHVAIDDEALDERLEQVDLGGRVALDEPEVEERHPTAGPEEVVAGVRVAVEGVQPVDAPEDEPKDRFGRVVAFVLRPRLDFREA